MRLLITVESAARGGVSRDLICEYAADTTVSDLAASLARSLSGSPGSPALTAATNVVDLRTREPVGPPLGTESVDLYLGAQQLDPGLRLDESGIRHGATVGVGSPSSHRDQEPVGPVEIRVVSGRGAGRVSRLSAGSATIGSGDQCTIVLDDPNVPEVAVRLELAVDGTVTVSADPTAAGREIEQPLRREPATEPIVLGASSMTPKRKRRWLRRRRVKVELELGDRIDPGAPLPLVRLQRRPVDESPTDWAVGDELGIGDTLLQRVDPGRPDASLSPAPSRPELDYNRPPRLHPPAGPREFTLPSEPRKPDKMPIPFTMMLMPMVMSGSSYLMTRSPYSLLIMLVMPLMLVLNATGSRRQQKKRWLAQIDDFNAKWVSVENAALEALVDDAARQKRSLPDPAGVLLFATGPRARLWERRRWDADFLQLRLGTADLGSHVIVKDPARAAHEGPLRWTVADVPVSVALVPTGVVGLAGQTHDTRRLASWLLAQVAALHSPTDAGLYIFTDADGEADWDWAKWLPHIRGPEGGRAVRIASDEDTRSGLVAELTAIIGSRRELDEKELESVGSVVVVLDGARELRLVAGMTSILKEGPRLGIHLICLDRTVHELPEECRSVVEVGDAVASVETTAERHIDAIRTDVVDDSWLDRLARSLAPVRDVSTEDASSTLPSASRLLEVIGLTEPDGDAIVTRWAGAGRTTRAVIGEGIDGAFTIDIRADGPHGLVAGTTGSGKSELLQTIIASLAAGNRPDEFTFVLIDYKGGAAFMDCQNLPHTVGMVTDLDGHLTTRALESLGAELHHRERQLADARAKDIEDYLAGRGPDDPPMPRLLIVIDEFAALAGELPDFVTGLVDVARRGRSLGVHLILATQRPAGVVNAEIKSNTNLRIALRVTDAGDSLDVIESKVAADISKSTPGRAYARLGASSLMPFQSARVGGRPSHGAATTVSAQSFDWDQLGTAGRFAAPGAGDDDVETPTDLATLVGAIRDAHQQLGIGELRKPWLPPLPEVLSIDDLDLRDPFPGPVEGIVPPVPIGLSDLPRLQRQQIETWDIENGSHLMIAGQARTGRSSALRTVAAVIARQCSPADVHLYGIDAGNNALLPLVALPHVGAVVTRLQVDRLYRLMDLLHREMARRQQRLAEQGFADIREQRAGVPTAERLPYLVVLLDRLEGYVQAFDGVDGGQLVDRLTTLLQEGAGAGIRVVIGSDRTGVLGRISMLVEDRIMLAMSEPSDYQAVGLSSREIPTSMPPGRAFRSGNERAREIQWAMLDRTGAGVEQVRALQDIGRAAQERWADLDRDRRPQRVDELPVSVTWDEAMALGPASPSPTFIGVGVGGDTLALHGFDPVTAGPGFMVAGPPRSGRSTALLTIAQAQVRTRRSVVVIAPRISPLRELRGVTLLTGTEPADELKKALNVRGPHTIIVDDFDVLGADSPAAAQVLEAFSRMRDTPNALVLAGGIDELIGTYRGVVAELKKGRSGLVLAPRASSDGEVLNAKLPRSAGAAMPTGRGVLTDPTGWRWVQVPHTAP